MLSAMTVDRKLKSLIHLSRWEVDQLKQIGYFCPACGAPVLIKNGQIKRPHFSHSKAADCFSSSDGETEEHIALKEMLADWCLKQQISFVLEPYLTQLKQRPDLLIGNIAIEIQCSPLSSRRLEERTKNYLAHGYTPVWILGEKLVSKKKLKEMTKKFCYFSDRLGFYLWIINWRKEELHLLFHIEEDWERNSYYVTKTWKFYSEKLTDILYYPTKAKIYSRRSFNTKKYMENYYRDIEDKLVRRNEDIRKIQEQLYLQFQHVLSLPYWFYYPGLRLFCCKNSDLFLKKKIWNLLENYSENEVTISKLINLFYKEMNESSQLFYDFPNINKSKIAMICSNQLLHQCFECEVLIKKGKGYQININSLKNKEGSLKKFLMNKNIKKFKTATPLKNMIR